MNGEEPQPSISSNMNHAILGCRNGRFRSSTRGRRNSSRPGIVEMVLVLEHAWESDGKWLVTLVYPWFYESLKLGLPRITCIEYYIELYSLEQQKFHIYQPRLSHNDSYYVY